MDDYKHEIEWWRGMLEGRIGYDRASVILEALLGYNRAASIEIQREDHSRLAAAIAAIERASSPTPSHLAEAGERRGERE